MICMFYGFSNSKRITLNLLIINTDIIFLYTLDRLFAYRFPAKGVSSKKADLAAMLFSIFTCA